MAQKAFPWDDETRVPELEKTIPTVQMRVLPVTVAASTTADGCNSQDELRIERVEAAI
jgi:hypothetical protein